MIPLAREVGAKDRRLGNRLYDISDDLWDFAAKLEPKSARSFVRGVQTLAKRNKKGRYFQAVTAKRRIRKHRSR